MKVTGILRLPAGYKIKDDGGFLVPYYWNEQMNELRSSNARLRNRNLESLAETIRAGAARITAEKDLLTVHRRVVRCDARLDALRDDLESALSMKALVVYVLLMTWLGIGCYVIARVWT